MDPAFHDHVDDVYADVILSPSSSFTSLRGFNGDHNNAVITLRFRVRCLTNYYGGDCATYCVRTDNSRGHYTCRSNGEKNCLSGWSNPAGNCLTRELHLELKCGKQDPDSHYKNYELDISSEITGLYIMIATPMG